MTPAEKRYFKREKDPNANGKANQTLELFDVINEMDEYDEDGVKEKMAADASFVKNLKIHKNRLQQLILKSLRSFNEESTASSRIRAAISDIELLLQKQLFELAYQNIVKTKELCMEYESYELLVVVLGIEARWQSTFKDHASAEEIAIDEMEKAAEMVLNYIRYAKINQTVLSLLNNQSLALFLDPANGKKLEQIIEKQILEPQLEPLSFVARRMHNHIFSMWHNYKRDYERASEYTLSSVVQFEQNEVLMNEKPVAYLSCFINHLLVKLDTQNVQDLDSLISRAMAFAEQHPVCGNLKIYIYYCWLRFNFITNNLIEIYKRWQAEIEPYLLQTHKKSDVASFSIRLQMVGALLILGKEEEAGALIVQLTNQKDVPIDTDMKVAYLLELIYHTEKKDTLFIDNLTAAHIKRIQRNKENLPFFKQMLAFFRKWANLPSGSKEMNLFLQQHLSIIDQMPDTPIKKVFFSVFDYRAWVEAKMHGVHLAVWRKR